jgi:membrane-associated phospholipid phosphatase
MKVERLEVTGAVAFLVAAALFAALAWGVESRTFVVSADLAATQWTLSHRWAVLTWLMLGISALNSPGAVSVWAVCFGVVLLRRGERYWFLTLALAVGGGMLLNEGLKLLFRRARPVLDDPLVLVHSFSFPSGHTAAATVLYGVLAAYLVYFTRTPRGRVAVIAAAVALVALVGLSRVYLGAHYPSDVLAAACSSTVWLILCLVGVHRLVQRRSALDPRHGGARRG